MDVIAELREQEPLFHRDQDPEALAAPDFWEVGASGQVYRRDVVLATVRDRREAGESDGWEAEDFACLELGPETYLLTYLLSQVDRRTRRATIWRRGLTGWQVLYHQGTVVQ